MALETINQKSFRQSKTLRDPLETTHSTKKHKLDHRLSSLQKANEAIDGLIEAMDLTESQSFWPKYTFNPTYRRIYQCIISRSLNPDENGVPEVDGRIKAQLEVLRIDTTFISEIKKCFEIERVVKQDKRRKVGGDVSVEAVKKLEDEIAKDLDFLMD